MKRDLRTGSGSGPEETLRSTLREWRVPAPPPGMEEDLRRAFRRRRGARRTAAWLATAAALAGLAAWPLLRKEAVPSVATGSPAVTVGAPLPMSGAAATERRPPERVEKAGARRRPGRPLATVREEVIIEPGQAELLVRFGEGLQDLRPPTTVLSGTQVAVVPAHASETPTLGGAEVPRYQAEWERVAGVWPLVQVSAPAVGR